jgi:hypothetical protein
MGLNCIQRMQLKRRMSLAALVSEIPNVHQQESLRKLMLRDEAYQIYMAGYEKTPEEDWANRKVQGTFSVLGTMGRDGVRSEYKIKFYKHGENAKGSFWCSCPEHKFQSTKKNIVCKHICFLVCRVGQLYSANFFNTKHLSSAEFAAFVNRVENNPNLMRDASICRSAETIITKNSQFMQHLREIAEDDMCAICFDEMHGAEENKILCCPDCHNNVHLDCVKVWLERNNTCVYCRSDVWRHYKKH